MNNPKLRFKREDSTDYPEWKKTKIGKLTKTFSASRVHREEWQTEGVPFWRSSDVMAFHQHKENAMGKAFITNELYEELSAKSGKMMKDDILITGGGSIGVPYLIPNNEPLYVKDADLLCIQKSDSHYPKFLYQFFWSPSFRNYLSVISHKGTIAHYTITQINETPIMMPCLEEQQKIADFLSTVDEVIAQSEAEVQNLEQQKKAAMQKIFSQEVRFKCEDGTDYPEWEEMTIGEVFIRFATGLNPRDNFVLNAPNSKNYYVTIKNFEHGKLMLDENCDLITDEALKLINIRSDLRKNDILMSSIGRVGDCYLITSQPLNWNINESVFVLRPNIEILYPLFAFHTIHSELVLNSILKQITGSTFKSIKMAQLKSTPMPIPCLEEQRKIADFLSAYDEAISYAKQELDKWKELKKGLLQQMFV